MGLEILIGVGIGLVIYVVVKVVKGSGDKGGDSVALPTCQDQVNNCQSDSGRIEALIKEASAQTSGLLQALLNCQGRR